VDGGDSTGCNVRCSVYVFLKNEHLKFKTYLYRCVRYRRVLLYFYRMLT